jgi:hypothetical protein
MPQVVSRAVFKNEFGVRFFPFCIYVKVCFRFKIYLNDVLFLIVLIL